jgi:putative transcriptional regulator
MRKAMREAIGETVQDMLNSDLPVSFTKRDFDELGIDFADVTITPEEIQAIRARTKLSQAVFARLLNVSLSSVRQWEQGKREPSGSTKVLLDLLNKSPHILDYRIMA